MSEPKVTKEDVMKASAGMLQKQLYVVFSTPTQGMGPVLENLEAHLKHQTSLEKSGVIFAAGPHWTDDEQAWEGDGMFIIRAKSLTEAKEIAASDPMHIKKARSFRVRPWMINEGAMTLKISFSSQGIEIV